MLSRLLLCTLLAALASAGVTTTTQRVPLRESGEDGKGTAGQAVRPPLTPAPTRASTLAYIPPRVPAPGTWSTIPNTAIYPVIPIEAKEGTGASTGNPELWQPQGIFEYSGGDLVTLNGTLGFLYWGGGHASTPDNSLYFAPFDGSGPRRLSGPYLAPDKIYKYDSPLERYRDVSRNQPSVKVAAAPKSRHTYSSLVTSYIGWRPHLFATGGSLYTGPGSSTPVTRMFDLSQTYDQAMARPDMGWRVVAPSLDSTTSAICAWDSRSKLAVCRLKNIWASYDPKADVWVRWLDPNYGGSDWEASAAIDVEGRRMFALGNRVAEILHLDTHKLLMQGTWEPTTAVATGPAWTRRFVTPVGMPGGYPNGPGLQWHAGRKRLLAYVGGQDILQIDPVAGTTEILTMGGVPIVRREDVGTYGRFRLLPDNPDLVVLATEVDRDVYIGRLPASGTAAPMSHGRVVPLDAPRRLPGTNLGHASGLSPVREQRRRAEAIPHRHSARAVSLHGASLGARTP